MPAFNAYQYPYPKTNGQGEWTCWGRWLHTKLAHSRAITTTKLLLISAQLSRLD